MGGQESKSSSDFGYFGPDDVLHFKSLFNSIVSTDDSTCCPAPEFQKYCESLLDDWLASRLTEKFSAPPNSDAVWITVQEFLSFLSELFLGTVEEKVKCIMLLATDGSDQITEEEIFKFTESIVESYLKTMEKTPSFSSWKGSAEIDRSSVTRFAKFLLSHILHPELKAKDILTAEPKKSCFDVEDLVKGLTELPLLLDLQTSVFSECFTFRTNEFGKNLIPPCLHVKRPFMPEEFTMLDVAEILFLNSQLPPELNQEWRYLFSTTADGESFSKLLASIQHQGATVIVVRETKGRVFGGFADECWALGPKFHGSRKCFLFHLEPKMLIYPATGFNENYQYMDILQQTLPNGLGMGGKLDYFGLWLDAEFGKGKSAPSCTTFVSPQLSVDEEFDIEALEVWGVGPAPSDEEMVRDRNPKSVLDQDPETRAVLELMNRPPASDGYRDIAKAYEEVTEDP